MDLRVIIDVNTIPEGLTLENVFNVMNNSGIVVWDSKSGGMAPRILKDGFTAKDIAFLTTDEMIERYEHLFEKHAESEESGT